MRALHALWQAADADAVKEDHTVADGLRALCRKTRLRSAEALGQLYRIEPIGVVQTVAEIWASVGGSSFVSPARRPVNATESTDDFSLSKTSLELLDTLAASSQGAVAGLCQMITSRAPSAADKGTARNGPLLGR